MTITLNSPNADNYYVGKGVLSAKFDGDADYVDLGNASEIEFTPTMDELEHFSSRQGVKELDRSVVVKKSGEFRVVLDEWTARNLSIILMSNVTVTAGVAEIDIFSTNVKGAAVKFTGENEVGPKWSLDLPRVEFAPGSAINFISEEWGTLEAKGKVISVAGSFGKARATFVESAPVNTFLPQIGGTAQVGHTLMAFPGIWTGSPTFAYQWQKGGVDIAGATGTTYVPVVGDIGATITVEVDATNSFSTVQAESLATAAVIAA